MPDSQRWISQREAAFLLQVGTGLTERLARRVLAEGLAGDPERTSSAHYYDRDRVHELAAVPVATEAELDTSCPNGLFVARRATNLGGGWRFSPWTGVWLRVRIERHGHFPLAATVGGYVVSGADIVGATSAGTLELREPGDWFATLRLRRLTAGPGRTWWIRGLDRPVRGRGGRPVDR